MTVKPVNCRSIGQGKALAVGRSVDSARQKTRLNTDADTRLHPCRPGEGWGLGQRPMDFILKALFVLGALIAAASSAWAAGPGEYGIAGCVVSNQELIGLSQHQHLEVTTHDPEDCPGWLLWPAHEYRESSEMMTSGAVDWAMVRWAFGGGVLLFSTGLGLGWIYSVALKSKKGF